MTEVDASVTGLLRALVEGREAVASLVDERVVLVRGDGSRVEGREAVVALFSGGDEGVRYRVLGVQGERVRVALEVPGVPGALGMTLSGSARGGVLTEVRVALG